MGGSVTGYALDASVAFFNPGALTALDTNYFNAGISLVRPNSSFLGKYDKQEDMASQLYTPFSVYGSYKLKSKWAAGLSVNTPFGLGTKWKDDWSGRFITQSARLTTVYIQPTIAYQLSSIVSVGAGPVMVLGRADLRKAIPVADAEHPFAQSELKGNGNGYGFNVGIYATEGKISLGLDYRSKVKIDLKDGTATFDNVPASLIANGTFPTSTSFNSSLELPSVLSLGVGYKVSDVLQLTFDFNYTGWKVYDSLNFEFKDHPSLNSYNERNYKNVFAVRFGGKYKWNTKTQFMGGLAYDQSPVQDGFVNPELPDANKVILSCGVAYQWKKSLSVGASFMFENLTERKEMHNAADNFNGTYKSFIYILGLGVQYAF
jgi:long-chain fatty acid transport protein